MTSAAAPASFASGGRAPAASGLQPLAGYGGGKDPASRRSPIALAGVGPPPRLILARSELTRALEPRPGPFPPLKDARPKPSADPSAHCSEPWPHAGRLAAGEPSRGQAPQSRKRHRRARARLLSVISLGRGSRREAWSGRFTALVNAHARQKKSPLSRLLTIAHEELNL
jgi:hypothetical protein